MAFRCFTILLLTTGTVFAQAKPAEQKSEPSIRYYNTKWSFDDVDVADLNGRLRRIGINLPVSLRGSVSANLQIGVPWGALRDPLAWRLNGDLSSGLLSINDWTIHDLTAEAAYRKGVLTLDHLQVSVPVDSRNVASRANTSQSGSLSGTARMDLRPGGDFTATLDVEDLPLQAIVGPFNISGPTTGRISGTLDAVVPVARLRSPGAWEVTGPVRAKQLSVRGLPQVGGDFQFTLKNSTAKVTDFQADTGPLRLSGDGSMQLSNEGTWLAVAQLDATDLNDAEQQIVDFLPEKIRRMIRERVRGKMEVTTKLKGTLIPFSVTGIGHFIATDLRVRIDADLAAPNGDRHFLQFNRIETDYEISQARLQLRDLKAEGPDVNASGDAILNFDDAYSWEYDGSLSVEQADQTTTTLSPFLPSWWTDVIAEIRGPMAVTGRLRGTTLPIAVAGSGTFRGTDNVVRFRERIAKPLALKTVKTQSIATHFEFDNDVLHLSEARVEVAGGHIDGSGEVPIGDPDALLTSSLSWDGLAPGNLMSRWVGESDSSSGALKFSVPLGELHDRTRWLASGEFHVDSLRVGRTELRDLSMSGLILKNGQLEFESLKASMGNNDVRATGMIEIVAPWMVLGDVHAIELKLTDVISLTQFDRLADQVSGMVSFDGKVDGTLTPLKLAYRGMVTGRDLAWDEFVADEVRLNVAVDSEALRFPQIDAKLFAGRITGNAEIPLTDAAAAKLDLKLLDIDTAAVIKPLDLPIIPGGLVSGELRLKAKHADYQRPAAWSIGLQLQIPNVKVNDLTIGDVRAKAEQENQRVTWHAEGGLFEGRIRVDGNRESPLGAHSENVPPVDSETSGANVGTTEVELTDGKLQAVLAAISESAAPQVEGNVSLKLAVEETTSEMTWNGEVAVTDARAGDVVLSPELRGKISGNSNRIQLDDLQGALAGGRLSASVIVDPGDAQHLNARVSLRSVRLERLKMLDPRTKDLPVSGFADFELKGRSGRIWHLRGLATTGQGTYGTLRFNGVRIPVTLNWTTETGRLRARSNSATASFAGGTVSGKFTMQLSRGLQVSAKGRFRNMQVAQISQIVSSKSTTRRGRIDGTFEVSGRNVQAIKDLDAEVRSEFRDTQAFGLPVLRGVPAFVPGVSSATSFREGRLNARLRGGVIDIDRLSLSSPQVSLFVSGIYNLSGRLRLDAVVSTGSQADLAVARFVASRLLAATPAGWLLIANDYLSNRTIHIAIHGTLQRPILRLKPVESLQEEALGFFLRQTLGVPVPAPAAQ